MKKFLPLLIALILTVLTTFAFAETVDYSTLSFDELLAIKKAVDLEYNSRPEAAGLNLAPGAYVVGEDIKPGHYYAAMVYPSDSGIKAYAYIYTSYEAYKKLDMHDRYIKLEVCDDPQILILEKNEALVVADASIFLKADQFKSSDYYTYAPPEGSTMIPEGDYIVGEEIPVGKYAIYAGIPGEVGYEVLVLSVNASGEKEFVRKEGFEYTKYVQSYATVNDILIELEEGDIFSPHKTVALKKWKGFTFGD